MGYYNKASKLLHEVGTKEFRELCTTNIGAKPKLNAVDAALEEKGISTDGFTEEDYSKAIEELGQGSEPIPYNVPKIRFIDPIKGLIAEVRSDTFTLDKAPTPLEHEGLIFSEWNHDLTTLNPLYYYDIGAIYLTGDGKEWFDIELPPYTDRLIKINLINPSTSYPISIEWGDDTSTVLKHNVDIATTANIQVPHSYPSNKQYRIKLSSLGPIQLGPNVITATTADGYNYYYALVAAFLNKCEPYNNSFNKVLALRYFSVGYSRPNRNIPIGSDNLNVLILSKNLLGYAPTSSTVSYVSYPSNKTLLDMNIISNSTIMNSLVLNSITYLTSNCIANCTIRTLYCNNIDTIKRLPFSNNSGRIQEIVFIAEERIPLLQGQLIYGNQSVIKIYVPDHLYDKWKVATNWALFAHQIYKLSER